MPEMAVYRVTSWGQPIGIGATGAIYAHVSAICKKNGPQNPYYVANELVAAELGRLLRLPVPPGFMVLDSNQTPYYASLDFNLTGVALPPVIAGNFIPTFKGSLGAILTFDILIANPDRHPQNMSADYGNSPRFNLFDHSHSLLGAGAPGTGVPCLQGAQNSIVINANHAIISGIDNEGLFLPALDRVESVPDFFIADVVQEAANYGLTASEANELTTFLQQRKSRVRTLISANKGLFPAIAHWSVL
jgi:hypothetical protein